MKIDDLKDLRAVIDEMGKRAPELRSKYGNIAAQTVVFGRARIIPTSTNEAFFPSLVNDSGTPRIYRSGLGGATEAPPSPTFSDFILVLIPANPIAAV